MIEKLLYDPNCWDCYEQSIVIASKEEIAAKINEIIDKVNELEIKTQVTKWFNPELEEELDKILEIDNSVGSVINGNDSERYDREKDEGDTLQQ